MISNRFMLEQKIEICRPYRLIGNVAACDFILFKIIFYFYEKNKKCRVYFMLLLIRTPSAVTCRLKSIQNQKLQLRKPTKNKHITRSSTVDGQVRYAGMVHKGYVGL